MAAVVKVLLWFKWDLLKTLQGTPPFKRVLVRGISVKLFWGGVEPPETDF